MNYTCNKKVVLSLFAVFSGLVSRRLMCGITSFYPDLSDYHFSSEKKNRISTLAVLRFELIYPLSFIRLKEDNVHGILQRKPPRNA